MASIRNRQSVCCSWFVLFLINRINCMVFLMRQIFIEISSIDLVDWIVLDSTMKFINKLRFVHMVVFHTLVFHTVNQKTVPSPFFFGTPFKKKIIRNKFMRGLKFHVTYWHWTCKITTTTKKTKRGMDFNKHVCYVRSNNVLLFLGYGITIWIDFPGNKFKRALLLFGEIFNCIDHSACLVAWRRPSIQIFDENCYHHLLQCN